MRKTNYEYVVFYQDDPYELPVLNLYLDDLVELTGKSKNAINKFFHRASHRETDKFMIHENYFIERFKKESEKVMFDDLLYLVKSGDMYREKDEKGSGGVYDFALEYVNNYLDNVLFIKETPAQKDIYTEFVYNVVYDIIDELLNKGE